MGQSITWVPKGTNLGSERHEFEFRKARIEISRWRFPITRIYRFPITRTSVTVRTCLFYLIGTRKKISSSSTFQMSYPKMTLPRWSTLCSLWQRSQTCATCFTRVVKIALKSSHPALVFHQSKIKIFSYSALVS